MTPQELKNSILQLAIQGKLVEQRPEEGVAEVPVARQHGGREARRHGEIEPPFDIPDSWRWVRLGEVALIERGSGIKRSETSPAGVPCVRYGEIYTTYGYTFTSTKSFVPESVASSCHMAKHGDVLCTLTGEWKEEIAKATAYLGKGPIAIGGDLAKISSTTFNPVLLVYFFFSPFMIQQKAAKANGTMIVHIGKDAISNLLLPLPPLAEQKRIVSKIEELLPLLARYEQAWTKLEAFNTRFPSDLQKSLLQLAIQGKLVEQRPEEGSGESLYRQIQSTRQHLVKTGMIKRDKRTNTTETPPEDIIPFDIPEGWKWVYLGSILNKLTDGTHKTPKYSTSGIKFVSVKDMSNGVLSLNNTKFITVSEHEELYARCNPERGDMLLSKVGTTGVPAIVDTDEPFSLFVSVALLKYSHEHIDERFLYYLLKSPLVQMQAEDNTRGVGNKNWVLDAIAKTLVPLPPLAEQKRIVAKLEELLPLCERLK